MMPEEFFWARAKNGTLVSGVIAGSNVPFASAAPSMLDRAPGNLSFRAMPRGELNGSFVNLSPKKGYGSKAAPLRGQGSALALLFWVNTLVVGSKADQKKREAFGESPYKK